MQKERHVAARYQGWKYTSLTLCIFLQSGLLDESSITISKHSFICINALYILQRFPFLDVKRWLSLALTASNHRGIVSHERWLAGRAQPPQSCWEKKILGMNSRTRKRKIGQPRRNNRASGRVKVWCARESKALMTLSASPQQWTRAIVGVSGRHFQLQTTIGRSK